MIRTGHVLLCIKKGRAKGITEGKKYIAWTSKVTQEVYIDNDEGKRQYYPKTYFKLVNEQK